MYVLLKSYLLLYTDSPASLCFYIFVAVVLLPDYSLEQLYERGFLSLCDLYWIFGYMSVGSNIFEWRLKSLNHFSHHLEKGVTSVLAWSIFIAHSITSYMWKPPLGLEAWGVDEGGDGGGAWGL